MKKLKRKRITRAKNTGRSSSRTMVNGFLFSDNQLKTMALTASLLSIYRSAKELGWLHSLTVLWEKLSTVLNLLYEFINKIL